MDFSQTKRIFIAVFLCLNFFLLFLILERRDILTPVSQNTINVAQELSEENIKGPALQEKSLDVPYLVTAPGTVAVEKEGEATFVNAKEEQTSKPIPLERPIETLNKAGKRDLSDLENFMQSSGFVNGGDYSFVAYYKSKREIVYAQKVGNVPVLDGSGQVTFYLDNNYRVVSYLATHIDHIEQQATKKRTITQKKAVEILYVNNLLPSNSRIETATLAYHQILKLKDMTVYSPVWYFDIVNDGALTTQRVDASSGKIVTPEIRK